jgi:hypothetical protein
MVYFLASSAREWPGGWFLGPGAGRDILSVDQKGRFILGREWNLQKFFYENFLWIGRPMTLLRPSDDSTESMYELIYAVCDYISQPSLCWVNWSALTLQDCVALRPSDRLLPVTPSEAPHSSPLPRPRGIFFVHTKSTLAPGQTSLRAAESRRVTHAVRIEYSAGRVCQTTPVLLATMDRLGPGGLPGPPGVATSFKSRRWPKNIP